jgi:hypothetical protein
MVAELQLTVGGLAGKLFLVLRNHRDLGMKAYAAATTAAAAARAVCD